MQFKTKKEKQAFRNGIGYACSKKNHIKDIQNKPSVKLNRQELSDYNEGFMDRAIYKMSSKIGKTSKFYNEGFADGEVAHFNLTARKRASKLLTKENKENLHKYGYVGF